MMDTFKESFEKDVMGLLGLYESSFHGLGGEDILDEAQDFASKHMKNLNLDEIPTSLARQVLHALDMPIHWRPNRWKLNWSKAEVYECIFLLSDSGEVMLEKQLTGHRVDRSICAWYWDHAISQGDQLQPVIASPTHYLFQIVREAITFLACSQVEMPPLMGIEFLCRAADVLADYLGGLNEDVIKDNFVIVYECIFLLSDSGEVMLEKQLTGHRVDRSICAWYWDHAISQGDQLQPVIASPTHYLFQIVREAITFLACSQVEMPPLMGIEFLCRAADVLADYLGGLNEDVIKDNFVIVYERGHQNSLEMMPMFFMLMIVGGLRHPCACACLGLLYIVSRFFYFKGYATGDP
ncbi:hypothetical protein NL676_017571 [Syzygium grande]|nr:hypothetical protein NL676_017571 [Syzygium grande]